MTDTSDNDGALDAALPFGLSWLPGEDPLRGPDYFRKILDVLPAAIYVTDSKGRINLLQ